MARTYTDHKLTDSMLKRLSTIVHGRPHLHGNALAALERRALVEQIGVKYQHSYKATAAGKEALCAARREGW